MFISLWRDLFVNNKRRATSISYSIRHKKPLADINQLISILTPFANKLTIANKQSLKFRVDGQHKCFLLHQGNITLYRHADGIALNSESAPYIFGLSTQLLEHDYFYIRTNETSDISVLSIDDANRIIDRSNLWKGVAALLIYSATRMFDHCTKISALSSYEIICYQLYELMDETEEVRNNVSIVSYILSRTFLSRSSIMKILAQLKTGNYIETEKGLLRAINNIPSKY
ncbi:helix-turn-helix domain-containing protein [Citrobacter braakii]|nr:helix-turn-helix domain-containing protein [Citrobacter braakii]